VFAHVPLVVVLPDTHELAGCEALELTAVLPEKLVMLPTNSLMRRWIDARFAEYGVSPKVALETSSMHSACRIAVRMGLIAIVDAFTAHGINGKGYVIRPLEPTLEIALGFVLPSDRLVNEMTSGLMQCVEIASEDLLKAIN